MSYGVPGYGRAAVSQLLSPAQSIAWHRRFQFENEGFWAEEWNADCAYGWNNPIAGE
jgi:hypothetical protein